MEQEEAGGKDTEMLGRPAAFGGKASPRAARRASAPASGPSPASPRSPATHRSPLSSHTDFTRSFGCRTATSGMLPPHSWLKDVAALPQSAPTQLLLLRFTGYSSAPPPSQRLGHPQSFSELGEGWKRS